MSPNIFIFLAILLRAWLKSAPQAIATLQTSKEFTNVSSIGAVHFIKHSEQICLGILAFDTELILNFVPAVLRLDWTSA